VVTDGAEVRSLAVRVRPVVLAHEQALAVPGPLGPLLDGGLVRGSVLVVDGALGAGRTSVLLHLLAAVTAAGEWAAIVTTAGTAGVPGPRAASEAGVELTRLAYVRDVPAARWATVVAALLDGCTAVVADPPPTLLRSDARRLLAGVRQLRAVLLTDERWP
jgi:predicted ATP-dependent serine protease